MSTNTKNQLISKKQKGNSQNTGVLLVMADLLIGIYLVFGFCCL